MMEIFVKHVPKGITISQNVKVCAIINFHV